VGSTGADGGRAASRIDDHSGAADSTTGEVEIWVASTSELRRGGGVVGVVAEGTLGETWTGLARGDELARKLDEVGGNVGRDGKLLEDRRLAEDDLLIEGHTFGLVCGLLRREAMRGGGLGDGSGDLFVETDGQPGACG
jgi:hypothetical protein